MTEPDLDVLIASNIGDLDAAARYLNNVLQPAIGAEMDEAIKAFKRERGWDGEEGFDEDDPWVAPKEWRKREGAPGEDFECQFGLEYKEGPAEVDHTFWLASLIGAGTGAFGWRWTRNDVNARAWRKAVNEQGEIVATIRALGFEHEEPKGSFFLPVRISQADLVEALRNETPAEALGPLRQALELLCTAKPKFDALLRATS